MSRFLPSDEAIDACREVIEEWKKEHQIDKNMDEPTHQLASRVRSWISPSSVAAGVQDIMSAFLAGPRQNEKINQLGQKLGARLMNDGLLVASLRRGGGLSS